MVSRCVVSSPCFCNICFEVSIQDRKSLSFLTLLEAFDNLVDAPRLYRFIVISPLEDSSYSVLAIQAYFIS